jgi:lipid-A-disaccharide synthase
MQRDASIFVSVAEDSADVHAASLIRTAAELGFAWRFYGLTGPRMRSAGCETLLDLTSHAAMLSGVLRILGKGLSAIRAVDQSWQRQRPDVVVLIDSPELHLPLARIARRRGLRVLYYIAPQTWASRERRNRLIARTVDKLACILPFEEAYFRGHGIDAEYVGHPLFESLHAERGRSSSDATGRPLIALLPGSRRHIIDAVLPIQLDVLRRLSEMGLAFDGAVSAVDADRAERIRAHLDARTDSSPRALDRGLQIVVADNARLLSAADLVLVASGTATLEVAYHRKPMIVLYDAGPPLSTLYPLFGRLVVRSPHLALVNVLAGARIVPEFMPSVPDPAAVATIARQLLTDAAWRGLMVEQLDALVRPLERSNASRRVCQIISEFPEPSSEPCHADGPA